MSLIIPLSVILAGICWGLYGIIKTLLFGHDDFEDFLYNIGSTLIVILILMWIF
jgi:hypothetical protein